MENAKDKISRNQNLRRNLFYYILRVSISISQFLNFYGQK